MPIYEFRCPACRAVYSQLFRHRDVEPPPCPRCGTTGERMISASFHVRGEARLLDEVEANHLVGEATGSGELPSEQRFAGWARRMHERFGDTLGQDFRAMAEKAEAGDNPIERLGVEHTLRYNIEKRKAELKGPAGPAPAGDSTAG